MTHLKDSKRIVLLSLLFLVIMTLTAVAFHAYIHHEIYEGNAQQLLTTYAQTNQTFTLFTERNWSALSDWDDYLRSISQSEDKAEKWDAFAHRKNNWQYSDFYVFNEDCDFLTADSRKGTADSIRNVFRKMFDIGEPTISAYTASNGVRKIVFAAPLQECFTLSNVTYTGIAISYDAAIVESMLSKDVYSDKSSCYLVNARGDTVVSLKPREADEDLLNLFSFLQEKVIFIEGSAEAAQAGITQGERGTAKFQTGTAAYYLTYQPTGINDWSLIGIVRSDAVDSGSQKILNLTMLTFTGLGLCLCALIWHIVSMQSRFELEKQKTLHEALETLANTDGLTGLFNERCFSSILHEKESGKLPFVLYYLDLDRFKPVNDTYGHDMGDKLLKEVAGRLKECTREQDYAFRIGGDEFSLIISSEMREAECEVLKNRIAASILRPYNIDGQCLQLGVSCGYGIYPREAEDVSQLRILADQRMYSEKEQNHRKQGCGEAH